MFATSFLDRRPAEDGMLAVQTGHGTQDAAKLRYVRILAGGGHGEHTDRIVLELRAKLVGGDFDWLQADVTIL